MKQQRRRWRAVAALCAALAFVAVVRWIATAGGPGGYTATVTIDTAGTSFGAIDGQYIGLSFESGTLDSGKFDDTRDLAQLLRNLGHGVIRFGGNSVDKSFTGITPSALNGLVRLVDAAGWQVLYSENMGSYNAASVAADAKAVDTALGDRLFAFACGNEPDLFASNGLRLKGYNLGDYLDQADACFQAIRAGAPNAPLEGPDIASTRWTAGYAAGEVGTIDWLGQHYYPLGCFTSGETPTAAADTLLSPALMAKETATFRVAVAAAEAASVPLVISETNSACGGGVPGLSDSYASALWVVDYMLTGAENNVHGMNFHGGLDGYCAGYTVLCQGANRGDDYSAQPIYYGLLLTHLFGTGRFLPVKVVTSGVENIAAFALKPTDGGSVRLIVENLSKEQLDATLHVDNVSGSATALTMTGPSLLATSGVQVQGASVKANGTFQPGHPDALACSVHACALTLAPYSAALVTVA